LFEKIYKYDRRLFLDALLKEQFKEVHAIQLDTKAPFEE
jgi:stress-induced morphogen